MTQQIEIPASFPGGGDVSGKRVVITGAGRGLGQLLAHGRVRRGWLGVAGMNAPLARRIARHHGIENASGVRVRSVERDSPAAAAGVESGDLVVSYDGQSISGIDKLQQTLDAQRIGRACEIVVLRHTRKLTLTATAIERPAAR